LQWSQYIDGEGHGSNEPNFEIWDSENSLIMTWMWHSSAREIWNDINNTFTLKKDFVAYYDFESRACLIPNWILSYIKIS